MTRKDILFAAITGFLVAFVFIDFFKNTEFEKLSCNLFWIFTLLSILGLWICEFFEKKYKFTLQAGKFFLLGAFVTIIDIYFYHISEFVLAFWAGSYIISKAISFLIATIVKFIGSKFWIFEKYEWQKVKKEIIQFLIITLMGLVIDVGIFYCATNFWQPTQISVSIWTNFSIIIAGLISAIWNFLGYKFIVFKK